MCIHAVVQNQSGWLSHPPLPEWRIFRHLSRSVSTWSILLINFLMCLADDSLRVTAAGMLLFPPYTDLGWDQNADAMSQISASEVASFRHIAGFGRPLFVHCRHLQSVSN